MKSNAIRVLILIIGICDFERSLCAYGIKINSPGDEELVKNHVPIKANVLPNQCEQNKSYKEITVVLDKYKDELKSIFSDLDEENVMTIYKSILFYESNWKQFNESGEVFTRINFDKKSKQIKSYDYGIAQINNKNSSLNQHVWKLEKIQKEEEYNLLASIQVLKNKKEEIDSIKKNSEKRWKYYIDRYDLKNHSECEILLKAYNGLVPQWDYVNRIKAIAAQKPWENQVAIQCLIDEGLINQQSIRLIDEYQYFWDSTSVKDGQHQIQAKIPQKSKDQVRVSVKNKNHVQVFTEGSAQSHALTEAVIEIIVFFPWDAAKYLQNLIGQENKFKSMTIEFTVKSLEPILMYFVDLEQTAYDEKNNTWTEARGTDYHYVLNINDYNRIIRWIKENDFVVVLLTRLLNENVIHPSLPKNVTIKDIKVVINTLP